MISSPYGVFIPATSTELLFVSAIASPHIPSAAASKPDWRAAGSRAFCALASNALAIARTALSRDFRARISSHPALASALRCQSRPHPNRKSGSTGARCAPLSSPITPASTHSAAVGSAPPDGGTEHPGPPTSPRPRAFLAAETVPLRPQTSLRPVRSPRPGSPPELTRLGNNVPTPAPRRLPAFLPTGALHDCISPQHGF